MSKPHNTVIIAGLSGVGKTYIINELKRSSEKFINFSAGTLIKKRLDNIDRDELRLLPEDEILRNQYVLVEQFEEELFSVKPDATVLFDAHIIIDANDRIIEVPLEIFKRLNPARLIFIYDSPKVILERRENDPARKRPKRTEKEIQDQQDLSQKNAAIYAQSLGIPCDFFKSGNLESLKAILIDNND